MGQNKVITLTCLIVCNLMTHIANAAENPLESLSVGLGGGFGKLKTTYSYNNRPASNIDGFVQFDLRFGSATAEPKLGIIHRSQTVDYIIEPDSKPAGIVELQDTGFFLDFVAPHRCRYISFGLRFEVLWGNFSEAAKKELWTHTNIRTNGFKQGNFYLLMINLNLPVADRFNFKTTGMAGLQGYTVWPNKDTQTGRIANAITWQLNFGLSVKVFKLKRNQNLSDSIE